MITLRIKFTLILLASLFVSLAHADFDLDNYIDKAKQSAASNAPEAKQLIDYYANDLKDGKIEPAANTGGNTLPGVIQAYLGGLVQNFGPEFPACLSYEITGSCELSDGETGVEVQYYWPVQDVSSGRFTQTLSIWDLFYKLPGPDGLSLYEYLMLGPGYYLKIPFFQALGMIRLGRLDFSSSEINWPDAWKLKFSNMFGAGKWQFDFHLTPTIGQQLINFSWFKGGGFGDFGDFSEFAASFSEMHAMFDQAKGVYNQVAGGVQEAMEFYNQLQDGLRFLQDAKEMKCWIEVAQFLVEIANLGQYTTAQLAANPMILEPYYQKLKSFSCLNAMRNANNYANLLDSIEGWAGPDMKPYLGKLEEFFRKLAGYWDIVQRLQSINVIEEFASFIQDLFSDSGSGGDSGMLTRLRELAGIITEYMDYVDKYHELLQNWLNKLLEELNFAKIIDEYVDQYITKYVQMGLYYMSSYWVYLIQESMSSYLGYVSTTIDLFTCHGAQIPKEVTSDAPGMIDYAKFPMMSEFRWPDQMNLARAFRNYVTQNNLDGGLSSKMSVIRPHLENFKNGVGENPNTMEMAKNLAIKNWGAKFPVTNITDTNYAEVAAGLNVVKAATLASKLDPESNFNFSPSKDKIQFTAPAFPDLGGSGSSGSDSVANPFGSVLMGGACGGAGVDGPTLRSSYQVEFDPARRNMFSGTQWKRFKCCISDID
jgi:hypothetical protein